MDQYVSRLYQTVHEDERKKIVQTEVALGMDWSKADFSFYEFPEVTFSEYGHEANFVQTKLRQTDLTHCDFTKANLYYAELNGANLALARFHDCNLVHAKFLGVKGDSIKMSGAVADHAHFLDAVLNDGYFWETTFIEASMIGVKMVGAMLVKCDMTGAELVRADFTGADLRGCNLSKSNLKDASLKGCIFSANTNLKGANLFRCKFMGSELKYAERNVDRICKNELDGKYDEAHDVYRSLKIYFTQEGVFDIAGDYYFREKLMEKKVLWEKHNLKLWVANNVYHFIAGYGEKPFWVIGWWLLLILGFGLIYQGIGGLTRGEQVVNLWENYYFSGVTFTTLGFGDIQPCINNPISQLLAMTEALIGAFMMALFVLTFGRKMMR